MTDSAARRIQPLSSDAISPEQRSLLEEWQSDRGQDHPPAELWWMLLRSPGGMQAIGKMGAFARVGTQLPEELREAAVLSVVIQRGFQFEIDIHRANLARAGVADDLRRAIEGRDFAALSIPMAAVARLGYAIADSGVPAAEVVENVKDELGEQGALEIGLVSAYFCMLSDVAATYGY